MACLSLSWHVYVHGILFELSSVYADTICDCVNRVSAVTLHGCLLSHMTYELCVCTHARALQCVSMSIVFK